MTQFEIGIQGLILCASLAMALVSYFVVYRSSRLEAYRQDLFTLRNRLWSFMWKKGLLDEPAHRKIRDNLNSLIRAAPYTNLFVLLPIMWKTPKSEDASIPDIIESVPDPETRLTLQKFHEATMNLLLRQLFISTAPGFIIGVPLILYVLAASRLRMLHARLWKGGQWRLWMPFQRLLRATTSSAMLGALAVGHTSGSDLQVN